jgi:transcriptional regulator with XRE-family HTH domain
MSLTHLAALRAASPGAPSARELARRIGCSVQAISLFESGRNAIGAKLIAAYAKELGAKPEVVERMFLLEAVRFHRKQAADAKSRLDAMPRGRLRVASIA